MHLRSIELQMPDRAAAVEFLKGPWDWGIASRDNKKLAASGDTFTYRPVAA